MDVSHHHLLSWPLDCGATYIRTSSAKSALRDTVTNLRDCTTNCGLDPSCGDKMSDFYYCNNFTFPATNEFTAFVHLSMK